MDAAEQREVGLRLLCLRRMPGQEVLLGLAPYWDRKVYRDRQLHREGLVRLQSLQHHLRMDSMRPSDASLEAYPA